MFFCVCQRRIEAGRRNRVAYYHRVLFYMTGLAVISAGVSLTIKADFGTGAWDALNVGLSQRVGLTVGSWVIIVGIVLTLLNALITHKRPAYFSLIALFLMGPLIDFWLLFAYKNIHPISIVSKTTVLFIGIFIIGLGAAIYLQAQFPVLPIDGLMLAIKERFHVNFLVAKTIGEICGLMLALLVKGPIGVGTIIVTFSVGPFIQLFFPYFEKLAKQLQVKGKLLD